MVLISFKLEKGLKDKFDDRIKEEGRIKKITISRAIDAWIDMNWGELFVEDGDG